MESSLKLRTENKHQTFVFNDTSTSFSVHTRTHHLTSSCACGSVYLDFDWPRTHLAPPLPDPGSHTLRLHLACRNTRAKRISHDIIHTREPMNKKKGDILLSQPITRPFRAADVNMRLWTVSCNKTLRVTAPHDSCVTHHTKGQVLTPYTTHYWCKKLTVSFDLLHTAVMSPAAVSITILLLQRWTDASFHWMLPVRAHTHKRLNCVFVHSYIQYRFMDLRSSPAVGEAETRGGRHGSSAVGSVCPPITGPSSVSVCALLSGL